MYLEGLQVPRDYSMAMYYFSNTTNPAFNTSNHLFGRGILYFYGLGVSKNETLGCQLFAEASRLNIGSGVFSYYNGLCALHRRDFQKAREFFYSAVYHTKFSPAIDAILQMDQLRLGQKVAGEKRHEFAPMLMNKIREYFSPLCEEIRRGNQEEDLNRSLLYAGISFDINFPYWATHLIDIFEQKIWKGKFPRFLYSSEEELNEFYREFVQYMISVSPANSYIVNIANMYLEGRHGFEQDVQMGKEMLMESSSKSSRFYLGLLNQRSELGQEDIEISKMNLDAAIEADSMAKPAMYYRLKLIVGLLIGCDLGEVHLEKDQKPSVDGCAGDFAEGVGTGSL